MAFRGSEAVASGLLTRAQLRSGAWRRLFRDIYVDARSDVTDRTRCEAVSRWLLPDGGAIAGRSAAALAGVWEPPGSVEIVAPPGAPVHSMPGLTVHQGTLFPGDVTVRDGMPVTSALRTCWDLALWLRVDEAVAVTDVLLARRLVTPAGLRQYAAGHAGVRGWRAMSRVVRLADGGAESPQESRLRVRLVLAGLPTPVTQHVVRAGRRFVARLDLAWPEYRVAVEYDGLWHRDPDQFHRDRRRLNQLLAEHWIVLHVTAPRLRDDVDSLVAEVRAALRAGRARTTAGTGHRVRGGDGSLRP